jgi:hypothetical protein
VEGRGESVDSELSNDLYVVGINASFENLDCIFYIISHHQLYLTIFFEKMANFI